MKMLAIDPGKTTGYALFVNSKLLEFGVWEYDPGLVTRVINGRITHTHQGLDHIVIEDWENQGKRVNIASTIPNRVIGWIESCAATYSIPVTYARASKWQVQFARGGELIKIPCQTSQKARRMAGAVYQGLGHWPFEKTPTKDLPHILDAVGLGLWWRCQKS
jgi:hypothetical protein